MNSNKISREREVLRDYLNIPKPKYLNLESRITPKQISLPEGLAKDCVELIRHTIKTYRVLGGECVIVPLSGGIDSSVAFVTAIKACQEDKTPVYPVFFVHNAMTEMELEELGVARKLSKEFDYELKEIDISDTVEALNKNTVVGEEVYRPITELENVARARNITIQSLATNLEGVTVCTANALEKWLNHYTTFDYRGNVAFLGDLLKTEVRELAKELGVPDWILDRPKITSELQQTYSNAVGADEGILDVVVYHLLKGKNPKEVAKDLGHDPEWVESLYEKRMIKQQVRQNLPAMSHINVRNYRDRGEDVIPTPAEIYTKDLEDSAFVRELDECRLKYMPGIDKD